MERRKFLSASLGMGMVGACGRGLLSAAATSAVLAPGAARAAVNIPINTWVRRPGPSSALGPTGANKHIKMTYNSTDHKVYLIGGDYTVPGITNGASQEMIYRYDAATDIWENMLSYANSGVAGYPEGRCAPGWCYDSKRDVMWFGMGQNRQPTPRPGLLRGSLWSYDPKVAQTSGQVWKLEGPCVQTPYAPGSPKLPANPGSEVWYMQYDPVTDALYVPYATGGKYLARYDLNGATIRNGVSKDNWSATGMSMPDYFLGEVQFALDSKRGKFVFYFPWPGLSDTSPGTNRGETWEYTTTAGAWLKLSDTVLPAKSTFGMVYDSANDKIVLFGGYDSHESGITNALNQTWVFERDPAGSNYHKWVQVNAGGTLPSPRKGETIAYDSFNNVIVQFGGRGWDNVPGDGSDVFLLRLGTVVGPNPPSGLTAA